MDNRRNSLVIGKVLLEFERLDSTNRYAWDMISDGKSIEGTVVSAGFQTAGKGQVGNTWISDAGSNLLLSFILHPKFMLPKHQFDLNRVTSLAIRDCLQVLGIDNTSIKWPNDVLVGGKKIAGILIRNLISHNRIQASVVGIGFNINQQFEDGEIKATSLHAILGSHQKTEEVRDILFSCLDKRYLQLKQGHNSKLHADYLKFLFRYETLSNYRLPDGKEFLGTIKGLDEYGRLIVEHEGIATVYSIKEIAFI